MPAAPVPPELPGLPARYQDPGATSGRAAAHRSHEDPDVANGRAPRVLALDGLRGVAILGVVAFHAGILPGGFLGVDLFFVLSGYLITGLLLHEFRATGNISLAHFWTRRARRLVPAILVLVAAAQIWARTRAMPSELAVINGQSAAAMVYGSNWFNILFNVGYWSRGVRDSPLNHLWSLAIEEQFYILFPLAVFAALVRGHLPMRTLIWLALTLAVGSFALTPWLFAEFGANRAYFGTDTRVGAILLGSALASWMFVRTENARVSKPPYSVSNAGGTNAGTATPAIDRQEFLVVSVAACIAVVVMLALWSVLETTSVFLYRGGLALHAVGSLCLIAAIALSPAGILARVLQWQPFVWLGERSYSLYLWHWPLIVVLTPTFTGFDGLTLVAITAAAIAVATLVSYEFIELPIRYSRLRGRRLVTALSLPAVAIAGSALLFQPLPPPQFGSNTLVTQGRGGIRLMLVGDSWARKLGIALAEVDSTHHMTIVNLGKGGCGIADARRQRTPEKGEFETSYDCLQWHMTWRSTVETVRPEVAILNVGNWDQALQDFAGTGEFVGACSAVFASRYSAQLDTAIAVLGERGATVLVMTIRDNDARDGSGPDCMNGLLRAAVKRHETQGTRLLDQYAQLCADHRCAAVVDGTAVYDETGHLATGPQRRIATWVLNSVEVLSTVR